MKVTTIVDIEPQEVEVVISVEDITAALAEVEDTPFAAFTLLNRCAQAMKAITDETVAAMRQEQRKVVDNFLTEQAARFRCENDRLHRTSEA